MKMYSIYLSFILCLVSRLCIAQTFQKTYGGSLSDGGYSIDKNPQGEFIIAGSTQSITGTTRAFLVKLSSAGDTIWTKSFGDSATVFYSVKHTLDNGYAAAGTVFNGSNQTIFLEKTDANGNTQWAKKIGSVTTLNSYTMTQTADSGYILAGTSHPASTNSQQIYVVKTNSVGDTMWTGGYYYGLQRPSSANSVQQTSDGGFIVAGYQSYQVNYVDILLIKTDGNGNHQWTKIFRLSSNNVGYCVNETNDGGFIIASRVGVYGTGTEEDMCLIKTDPFGNIVWTSLFSGPTGDVIRKVKQTTDKGFILAGNTFSFGAGSCDASLIKTDSVGNMVWSKVYGGTDCDVFNDVTETGNGGYAAVGLVGSFGIGGNDVYFVKTDSAGNSGCNESSAALFTVTHPTVFDSSMTPVRYYGGVATSITPVPISGCNITTLCNLTGIHEIEKENLSIVYPNPSTGIFIITTNEINDVDVYDRMGIKLLFKVSKEESSKNISIDLSDFPNGIYFARLKSYHKNRVMKLIIAR